MNSTDLIIGHFEGTLTPAEASQLDELLKSSPEVRAAFEQQRSIEEGLVEDSEALVPPFGLREATLAAAIGGGLSATVGGGIAAWLSTKAAVVISTLAIGGVIVGGIVLTGDDVGEEAETVVQPAQIEKVESSDPGSQTVRIEQNAPDNDPTPATSSVPDAGSAISGRQQANSERVSETNASPDRRVNAEGSDQNTQELQMYDENNTNTVHGKPVVVDSESEGN